MAFLKFSFALFLASICLPAQASLLRISYDVDTILSPSTWLLSAPPPDQIHIAFTVDTNSADTTNLDLFTDASSNACLGDFHHSGIDMSGIAIASGSMAFGSTPSSTVGSFSGSEGSPHCPGGFFGSFGFNTGDAGLYLSVDFAGMSQAQLQSSGDVMGDLLTNMTASHVDGHLTGAWGNLIVSSPGRGTITKVPEPEALGLFGAGLLGLAARRLRARKPRA